MQCQVCGSNDFINRGGFRSCNVCGVQIAEAEQRLEYDDAIAPSRKKETFKKVNTNQASQLTDEAFTLIDSRVLLESFHFLLKAQVEALIVHSRCSVELVDLVGRLFVNYINEWRSHGWAADDSKLIVYPSSVSRTRFTEQHPWGQPQPLPGSDTNHPTVEIPHVSGQTSDVSEDDEQLESDEDWEPSDSQSGTSHRTTKVKHEARSDNTNNDENANKDSKMHLADQLQLPNDDSSSNVNKKRWRRRRENKFGVKVLVLRAGELSLSLSIAFLYIGCLIAREPVSLQELCSLSRAGSLPYMSLLYGPSSRLPERLVQLIKCSYRLVSFYTPPYPPNPREIFERAALISLKLGLHPTWYGPQLAISLVLPRQSSYHLVRVDGVRTNTNGMVRSLMAQLTVPVEIEPLALELLRIHSSLSHYGLERDRDIQDELTVAGSVFLACQLVFGLDREFIDPMLNGIYSLIDEYTIDYVTRAQMRGWLMTKFRLTEKVARQKMQDFKEAIDKRVEDVYLLREETDAAALEDKSRQPTDWLPSEVRAVIEHFTQFRRIHGHTVDSIQDVWKKECDNISLNRWKKKPTLRALYKFKIRAIIDRRFWLESLAPPKGPAKPAAKPPKDPAKPPKDPAKPRKRRKPASKPASESAQAFAADEEKKQPSASRPPPSASRPPPSAPLLPIYPSIARFEEHCSAFVESLKHSERQSDMARRVDEEIMLRVPQLMHPSVIASNPKKLKAFLEYWKEQSIGPGLIEPSYEDLRDFLRRAKQRHDGEDEHDDDDDEKMTEQSDYQSISKNHFTSNPPLSEFWDSLTANLSEMAFKRLAKFKSDSLEAPELALPHDYMTLMLAICVIMGITVQQFELYIWKFTIKLTKSSAATKPRRKLRGRERNNLPFDENGVFKLERTRARRASSSSDSSSSDS